VRLSLSDTTATSATFFRGIPSRARAKERQSTDRERRNAKDENSNDVRRETARSPNDFASHTLYVV